MPRIIHTNRLLWVSLRGMTFGLTFDFQGYCVDAPPIAKWCKGKRASYLETYWHNRGAELRWID